MTTRLTLCLALLLCLTGDILVSCNPARPAATPLPTSTRLSLSATPFLPTPSPGQLTDVIIATIEGAPLTLDIYLPVSDVYPPVLHPAVILFPDNPYQPGNKAEMALLGERLAEWGYVAYAINPRLSSTESAFPAAVAYVQCAVTWVRMHAGHYDVDRDQIALMGTGYGGYLAALAGLASVPSAPAPSWQPSCGEPGTDTHVQAIISLFAPLDLAYHAENDEAQSVVTALLGQPSQSAPDLCTAASPITYANADAPPTLLIHGTADQAISPKNSARMYAALQAVGAAVTYLPIEGAGYRFIFHGSTPQTGQALEAIRAFLSEVLPFPEIKPFTPTPVR